MCCADTSPALKPDRHLENKSPIYCVHLRVANGIMEPAGWSAGARRSKVSPQLDLHSNRFSGPPPLLATSAVFSTIPQCFYFYLFFCEKEQMKMSFRAAGKEFVWPMFRREALTERIVGKRMSLS